MPNVGNNCCNCTTTPCNWSLCASMAAECGLGSGIGPTALWQRPTLALRFQGPDGTDTTFYSRFADTATARIDRFATGTLAAVVTHPGAGYTHSGGFPYVPTSTWSGGTLTGGGTPTSGDYPTAIIAVDLGGSVSSIVLSGHVGGWATAPILTIADPDTLTDRSSVCLSNPAEGNWTITLSHPCYPDTQVRTVTVVRCRNQTIPVLVLPLPFTTIDYSDEYGSFTQSIVPNVCFVNGSYVFPAEDTAGTMLCGYITGCVWQIPGNVTHRVQVIFGSSDDGWHFRATWNRDSQIVHTGCNFEQVMRKRSDASTILCDQPAGYGMVGARSNAPAAPCGSAYDATGTYAACNWFGFGPWPPSWDLSDRDCTDAPSGFEVTAS